MKKIKKNTLISFCTTLILLVIIFNFSAQDNLSSDSTSKAVTEVFSRVIFTDYEDFNPAQQGFIISELNFFVRKAAHFTLYLLLGMSVSQTISGFFKRTLLPAVLLCAVFAAADELHQLFVSGRSGNFSDVLLDTAGAFTGIVLLKGIFVLINTIKNNKCIKSEDTV